VPRGGVSRVACRGFRFHEHHDLTGSDEPQIVSRDALDGLGVTSEACRLFAKRGIVGVKRGDLCG